MEKIHCFHCCGIVPVTTSRVIRFRRAFYRDHQDQITKTLKLVTEFLIYKRRVGECGKLTVAVLFHKAKDVVLSDERLSTCHEIKMRAECFSFGHDLIHIVKRKAALAAVCT